MEGLRSERPPLAAQAAILAGLAGAALITVVCVVTAVAYVGSGGERYSPLNHFISELGELRHSELAAVFNVGLMIGGLCLSVHLVGLGLVVGGITGVLGATVGLVAGVAGTGVGVFPMDDLSRHGLVALTFFSLSPIAIALLTTPRALVRTSVAPRGRIAVGVFSVVAFIAFVALVLSTGVGTEGLAAPEDRRDLSPVTILEWLAFAGILAWVVLASLDLRRKLAAR